MMGFHAILVFLFLAPTFAQDVKLDLECYPPGQGFLVTYSGATEVDDWVGFVPVSELDSNLVIQEADYKAWAWKCGSLHCAQTSGTVFVSNTVSPGEYVAVMARNALQEPYQGFAASEVIRVALDCDGGAPDETGLAKISVEGSSFKAGDPFWVNFKDHASPLNSDFISIFPADMPPSQLQNGNLWKWTCNRQGGFCGLALNNGRVRMDGTSLWTSPWPLPQGSYRAYLMRNQANPFWVVVARSEPFTITSGDGTPTPPVPVPAPVTPPTQAPQKAPSVNIPLPTFAPVKVPVVQPTNAPVRGPTQAPQKAPTNAPVTTPTGGTELTARVTVEKTNFAVGEPIRVSYSDHTTHDRSDFIAIYSSDVDINALADGLLWKWASCNRQGNFCPSSSPAGTVAIGTNSQWMATSLAPGSYRAVLLRNIADPFWQLIAASEVFTVSVVTAPTQAPVDNPVPVPAPVPVPVPVSAPVGADSNVQAARDLAAARSMLEGMIADDDDLAPKFLRLIFHDCIGGCDGCVDLNNPENFGLDKPIDALERVFEQHGGVISRADIWALSSTVAVDVVQSQNDRIDFPFKFWGREDCTLRETCTGANGQSVPCTPKFGPHHEHPEIHLNTADLYHFFATEFGFNAREAVVAMAGGHTIGSLSVANSGIDGPNGWVPNNKVFDKEYFDEVIGGNRPDAPMDVLVNEAPRWRRAIDPPTDVFTNRRIWDGFPDPDKRIIMLNTDMALFRQLDNSNYDDDIGRARCGFEDDTSAEASIPQCPHIEAAVLAGAELKHDNVRFKREFRGVLVKMVSIGYNRPNCSGDACKLVKR